MTFDPLANFAYGTVLTPPSPAASGVLLTLNAGQGSSFPDPAVSGAYNTTICPAGQVPTTANSEVVRVMARAGDVFTITRAQEGSSARTVQVGDRFVLSATAKTFTDIESVVTANSLAALNAPYVVYRDGSNLRVRRRSDGAIIYSGAVEFGAALGAVIDDTGNNGFELVVGETGGPIPMTTVPAWPAALTDWMKILGESTRAGIRFGDVGRKLLGVTGGADAAHHALYKYLWMEGLTLDMNSSAWGANATNGLIGSLTNGTQEKWIAFQHIRLLNLYLKGGPIPTQGFRNIWFNLSGQQNVPGESGSDDYSDIEIGWIHGGTSDYTAGGTGLIKIACDLVSPNGGGGIYGANATYARGGPIRIHDIDYYTGTDSPGYSSSSSGAYVGSYARGAGDLIIEDSSFRGVPDVAIEIDQPMHAYVRNVTSRNCHNFLANSFCSPYVAGVQQWIWDSCTFINDVRTDTGVAFDISMDATAQPDMGAVIVRDAFVYFGTPTLRAILRSALQISAGALLDSVEWSGKVRDVGWTYDASGLQLTTPYLFALKGGGASKRMRLRIDASVKINGSRDTSLGSQNLTYLVLGDTGGAYIDYDGGEITVDATFGGAGLTAGNFTVLDHGANHASPVDIRGVGPRVVVKQITGDTQPRIEHFHNSLGLGFTDYYISDRHRLGAGPAGLRTSLYDGVYAASYTTAFGGNGDVRFTAVTVGSGGNAITVAYTNDGPSTPLTVSVIGNAITVHLATNGGGVITSTASDVIAAVNAFGAAAALVTASIPLNVEVVATGLVQAFAAQNLTLGGGVSVQGNAFIMGRDLNSVMAGISTQDLIKNNSNVFANIIGCAVPVESNAVYRLEAHVNYDASTAGDVKVILTGPAGMTYSMWPIGIGTGSTTSTGQITANDKSAGNGVQFGGAGVGTVLDGLVYGILKTGNTRGTVQMQGAQTTADATNATFHSGLCILMLTRIG